MKSCSHIALALLLVAAPATQAATFYLNQQTDVVAPTGRGGANTTYFGWEAFNDPAPFSGVLNDTTPDIGSAITGAAFVTNNGEDHISGSGNFYSGAGSLNETLSIPTNGVVGTGFTTLIVQGITAFGPFGTVMTFSDINGVSPTYVGGMNATGGSGKEQFVLRYDLPGNQSIYDILMTSAANSFQSFDRIVVDTFWSETGFQGDVFIAAPEPSRALLGMAGLVFVGLRRRRQQPRASAA